MKYISSSSVYWAWIQKQNFIQNQYDIWHISNHFCFFFLMKSKQNMKNNNAKSMKNLLTNKLLRIFSLRMLHRIHWKWPILQRHRWMCNWWVFSSFYYFDYDWATIYPKFVIHKKIFAYHLYTARNSSLRKQSRKNNWLFQFETTTWPLTDNFFPNDIFNVKTPQLSKNRVGPITPSSWPPGVV